MKKSKTRNKFLLHYDVYCDYTYGYCVNQYLLYIETVVVSSVCLQQEGKQAD